MRTVPLVMMMTIATCAPPLQAEPDPFPYAVARRGCTQEDAPALEIVLSRDRAAGRGEPVPPFVRIEMAWGSWTRAGDSAMTLVPLSRRGLDRSKPLVRAEWSPERGVRPAWLTGTVRVQRVEPDAPVEGVYDFVLPSGKALRGAFSAAWGEGAGGCG